MNIFKLKIHREGWPFIAIFILVAIVLFTIEDWLGWIGLILTAWCLFFFRDPDRVTPVRQGLFISGADGIVLPIVDAVPPAELDLGDEPLLRISVFMNVFDVHVNRIPCDARVERLAYRKGRFINASFDKASEQNERMSIKLRMQGIPEEADPHIGIVQIAGLVARRIRCELIEGQDVIAGERLGIIRFGSRVDHFLPKDVQPMVVAGQRTVAGETVIADLASAESARIGRVR